MATILSQDEIDARLGSGAEIERQARTSTVPKEAVSVSTLSALLVRAGDRVEAGQLVGRVGRSGRATGPHLHSELAQIGRRVDPAWMAPHVLSPLKNLHTVADAFNSGVSGRRGVTEPPMKIEGKRPDREPAPAERLDPARARRSGDTERRTTGATDRVDVSSQTQFVRETIHLAEQAPDVRRPLIERMKRRLALGEIGRDVQRLADSLIDHLLNR